MKLKEIMDEIYNHGTQDQMDEASEIIYDIFDWVENRDAEAYKQLVKRAEDVRYIYTIDDAQRIVRGMIPYGEVWTYDDVKQFIRNKGIESDCKAYYLVMNAMYNDYRRTAQEIGNDNAEFYFALSKDFITDQDGKSHKVEKYFME